LTAGSPFRLSLIARLPPTPRASVQRQREQGALVDELLAAHADAVYRYALRLTRDVQAAQDLAQETLLRAWKARHTLREAAAARVWLLRIATNLHRDGRRAGRVVEPIVVEPVDGRPSIDGRLEHKECVELALAALDALPQRQRHVMHLITIDQLTHQQAADVLGVTVDAVKASLSLARRQMREQLKDLYDEVRGTPTT
jgi:RNA polymerase sigma-70 factor, ECF subfamily